MTNKIQHILYAADLGDNSEVALAFAINLANRLGARLQVLSVIKDIREQSVVEIDTGVPQDKIDQYHDDQIKRVKGHIEAQIAAFYALRQDEKPSNPITEVEVQESDDIAQLILDEAKSNSTDMIVMASRGGKSLIALLFGSVVVNVARKSPVPLLLVPVGD